jgi:hypothetical protein
MKLDSILTWWPTASHVLALGKGASASGSAEVSRGSPTVPGSEVVATWDAFHELTARLELGSMRYFAATGAAGTLVVIEETPAGCPIAIVDDATSEELSDQASLVARFDSVMRSFS